MTKAEVLEMLRLYTKSGDRVRLAYTVNGRSIKDEHTQSAIEAQYAVETVYNLGGHVSTIFRIEP